MVASEIMLCKRCETLLSMIVNAGTIADPHVLPAHGECEEVMLVTDRADLAAHGML